MRTYLRHVTLHTYLCHHVSSISHKPAGSREMFEIWCREYEPKVPCLRYVRNVPCPTCAQMPCHRFVCTGMLVSASRKSANSSVSNVPLNVWNLPAPPEICCPTSRGTLQSNDRVVDLTTVSHAFMLRVPMSASVSVTVSASVFVSVSVSLSMSMSVSVSVSVSTFPAISCLALHLISQQHREQHRDRHRHRHRQTQTQTQTQSQAESLCCLCHCLCLCLCLYLCLCLCQRC